MGCCLSMSKLRKNKNGQGFTIDYIIGLLIFIFLVVIASKLFINIVPDFSYKTTYRNNVYLADTLLGQAYPSNWNNSNVILPGIANNNVRINTTLLSRFDNLSYDRTKTLFHLENEYLFFFKNASGIINMSRCVHGYPIIVNSTCYPQLDENTYEHLTTIKRLVILEGKVVEMDVFVWRK